MSECTTAVAIKRCGCCKAELPASFFYEITIKGEKAYYAYCKSCQSRRAKTKRDLRLTLGRCVVCGTQPPRQGASRCQDCADRHTYVYEAKRRERTKQRNQLKRDHALAGLSTLSESEWGYLAGIIDGEGCITVKCQPNMTGLSIRLQINNTNLALILWLQERVPGYVYRPREGVQS